MKHFLGFILSLSLLLPACKKDGEAGCNITTVTNSAPGCGGWGIVVSGRKYPSRNVPDQFKQDGLKVCANYELYEDLGLCVCCGGTWANIKAIQQVQ